jgi:hypothetical protein
MWGPLGHPGWGLDHTSAEQKTDQHDAYCAMCAAGVVCAISDDVYEAEFRTYDRWRRLDRPGALPFMRSSCTDF